jgi:tetraacyldisaccharide 4'-kinase
VRITPERWRAVIRGEAKDASARMLRPLLGMARLPYGAGVWWRNRRFDRGVGVVQVDCPVISVGNLTLGGTGKTPCVEYIASLLREHDFQVAILSRGYGSEQGRNDEAMVLEENLPDVPHFQGPDRVEMARIAMVEAESEVLLLDDGFQHRRISRQLDIVLIDASDPWGSNRLFPRGALREPCRNLARANHILITRADQATNLDQLRDEIRRLAPGKPIAESCHEPKELLLGTESQPLALLAGKRIACLSGLGNPESFEKTLKDLGAILVDSKRFPDHHNYSREDVNELTRWANSLSLEAGIVTTQKDWVKLRIDSLDNVPLRSLRIGLNITAGKTRFDADILATTQHLAGEAHEAF